jgi:hypothetical protein
MGTIIKRLCLVAMILASVGAPASAKPKLKVKMQHVMAAIACFQGLAEGERLLVKHWPLRFRIARGPVPQTSGGFEHDKPYEILIEDGSGGAELREFAVVGDHVMIMGERYDLRFSRKKRAFEVVDGNGGGATYEAIARFVNRTMVKAATIEVPEVAAQTDGCLN